MSRPLPTRPSLEHLKKQAKDRLADLQRENQEAKLADALHTVARDYGFATWPKLKMAVEELQNCDSAGARNPFVGIWRADVSKSTRHPANQFQRATLQFAVEGDAVTITNVVVNATNGEDRGVHAIRADGVERGSDDGSGYSLMARWLGSHTLETVAKKGGAIVGRGMYEVSPDGRTLTASTRNAGAYADGWQSEVDQKIVFDRVESQEDQEDQERNSDRAVRSRRLRLRRRASHPSCLCDLTVINSFLVFLIFLSFL